MVRPGFFDVGTRPSEPSAHGESLEQLRGLYRLADGQTEYQIRVRLSSMRSVWADSAYQSATKGAIPAKHGLVGRISRRGPRHRPPSEIERRRNAHGDRRMALAAIMIRGVGPMRANAKIGLMNLGYIMRRFVWLRSGDAGGVRPHAAPFSRLTEGALWASA